jgi:predicted amidohydrolase
MVDRPTGMKEGIGLVEIDLGDVERVRREWSFFKDRRPETYGEILGEKEF